ncbi:choline/glycine/proline betaine transport protein [Frigoribacterium sp. PhB160]|uniref:BCCT family transporter n=1 Tax=Frigoribacterium sp. PhB160 TaxID=2485192 RepID=UPI000F4852B2|nr:BCCT family transporter [Frigoribacterium sp. PhB160]ROS61939.1 choline/glycine/proline betaine transport protein [Frigoribacterium sp. PhB160]
MNDADDSAPRETADARTTGSTSAAPGAVTTTDEEARAGTRRKPAFAPWVFWPAAAIILAFVVFAMLFPAVAEGLFGAVQSGIVGAFGWYYVLLAAVFVAFALWMGLSRYGDIKLGKDDDEPEFSRGSWLSMLFAAGMGIGLVFYGVAEPLSHYASPRPGVTGTDNELAGQALSQTYLHWGVHAWSIYIVVGLGMAYAIHRRGRPVSIRWALEPLLGDRVKGVWGNVIDVVSVVGTLFGVATSLGLGVLQISAGLSAAGIAEPTIVIQVVLIAAITGVTIFSLVSGVAKGMKWLSNVNIVLAALLLVFVLVSGPTLFLLRDFVQSLGAYLQNVVGLTFTVSAFSGAEGEAWQGSWTTFYWGWWMSWAPFVGIFIARISKGRTVREFVVGVLVVPTILTFLWFSVMGGAALYREVFGGGGLVSSDGSVDTEGALFEMLQGLPGGSVAVFGAILLIGLFFITSSDSGSLVLGMISTGGDTEPKVWVRIFWAVVTALVAIALLLTGGLDALKTAAIITALPFSVVMIGICVATFRAFDDEHRKFLRAQRRQLRDSIGDHYGLEEARPARRSILGLGRRR